MMTNEDMENTNYTTIPEWVRVSRISFMRICHEVGMSLWVEGVLTSATIVGGVVYTEDFVAI